MSVDTDGFQWWGHPRAARLIAIVVLIVVFLYAGFTGNRLAMRGANFMAGVAMFGLGGSYLQQSGISVARKTGAGLCLVVSGIAFAFASISAPLDGLLIFGDTNALSTDIGVILVFVGGALGRWTE